jgi:hypothetical protein
VGRAIGGFFNAADRMGCTNCDDEARDGKSAADEGERAGDGQSSAMKRCEVVKKASVQYGWQQYGQPRRHVCSKEVVCVLVRLEWDFALPCDRRGIQEKRVGLGGGLKERVRRLRGEGVVGGDEVVVMDVGEEDRFAEPEGS